MRYADEVVVNKPVLSGQELQKSISELEIKNYGHVCNNTAIRFTSNPPKKLSRDGRIVEIK